MTPSPVTAPTDVAGRIHGLDILRGFALLGMIVVHFHDHSLERGGIDDVVRTFIWRVVEGKSHGTFALLFGAGFALQLRRAEARRAPFARLYLRRLATLAAFGFAAHAFFGFNVLLGYAAWGVPLLVIRRWSTRALIALAIFSAASVGIYRAAETGYYALTRGSGAHEAVMQAQRAVARDVNVALDAAEQQDSYRVLLAARLRHMRWFYAQPFSFMPGATLALFIVGLLAVRHGLFERTREWTRTIIVVMSFGLVSWIADNWVIPFSFGLIRDQWLTFTYVGAGVLLLAYRPELVARLRLFGLAGRMALTNYLLQIALLDLTFSGYALHIGLIRPVYGPIAALTVFAAEVVLSWFWLARFRFGPAEWLWRSVTYGRAQPLKRAA